MRQALVHICGKQTLSAKRAEPLRQHPHVAAQNSELLARGRAAGLKPLAAARPRSAFAFRSPARALTADLPHRHHIYFTTDKLFRFYNENSMKCLVNWIPLRIRFRSRNTLPHLQIKYALVTHTNLHVVAAKESSNGVETLSS